MLRHALHGLQSRDIGRNDRDHLGGRAPRAALSALIVSIPLVSVLTMIWLWRDTGDVARLADHAQSTFWLVLPTLPGFLLVAALLRGGLPFWGALLAGAIFIVALYIVAIAVLS